MPLPAFSPAACTGCDNIRNSLCLIFSPTRAQKPGQPAVYRKVGSDNFNAFAGVFTGKSGVAKIRGPALGETPAKASTTTRQTDKRLPYFFIFCLCRCFSPAT